MKQVKGAALMHFVKTIRADKSGIYNKYFDKDDLAIISKNISPAIWYPYETFKRCFNAVCEIIVKKDNEKVKDWGKLYGELIMTDAFKTTIKKDNPLEHLRRIPVYIKTFLDFGTAEVTVENPNRVTLKLKDYDPNFPLLFIFLQGWFQKMVELCGGKNVKCEIVEKSWDKKTDITSYLVTWS